MQGLRKTPAWTPARQKNLGVESWFFLKTPDPCINPCILQPLKNIAFSGVAGVSGVFQYVLQERQKCP
jgi:hypothetical protein